jgi:Ser/Thr protein kinase RdoA (MazF antagonist)
MGSVVEEVSVFSPYGKDVQRELQSVYGVEKLDELVSRVEEATRTLWGLPGRVDQVHVAFGIAVRFRSAADAYYLKLASTRNAAQPELLFRLIAQQRRAGLPVIDVVPTLRGASSANLLEDTGSCYDFAYVMRAARGSLLTQPCRDSLESYAATLARLHRAGEAFEPRLRAVVNPIVAPSDLPRTHLHGDARLCHVFFDGTRVTDLIDPDQAAWGERILDLVQAAVSHPDPARAALLDPVLIRAFIEAYARETPLTDAERAALPAALRAAVAEALADVRLVHARDPQRVSAADVARVEALAHVQW